MTKSPSGSGPRSARESARLDPPDAIREIVARLEREGHETWCVGGAVRDALLGHPQLDWDLATAATPQQVMRLFRRTVPVGIDFGTVGVLDEAGILHEVTTFRRDVRTDGRHAVVEFGASLEDDLARRDFTINAIAYHPKRDELRDPFDGRADLDQRLVRAVGVAADRLREDRLRALRAIRFAARFGFTIEPVTWRAIVESSSYLSRLSPERVKQELEKTMEQVERPSIALESWREAGALAALVPAIANAPADRFAALDHLARETEAGRKGAVLNRLAMLFFGEAPGAVERATKALRFSNADVSWITHLASARAALGAEMDETFQDHDPNDAQLRRWAATAGRTRTGAFMELSVALWRARLAQQPDAKVEARLSGLIDRATAIAFRDPIELSDLAVDGEDLRSVNIPPGPDLGRILRTLLDRVIDDPAQNQRDRLLTIARTLV